MSFQARLSDDRDTSVHGQFIERATWMPAFPEQLRRRRKDLRDEGGFSLIELLIVIVIQGIPAAIVVFVVQSMTSRSSKASCGSDIKTDRSLGRLQGPKLPASGLLADTAGSGTGSVHQCTGRSCMSLRRWHRWANVADEHVSMTSPVHP